MSTSQGEVALGDPQQLSETVASASIGGSRLSYFRYKAILDRILAALLLIPGVPMIAALILLVRATSRGPGIYKQVRVGKDGRDFEMFKIRTMRQDAEVKSGAVWTQANDSRITWVGAILRRLHLDELPQLFNVLRGEMSLIGPRPERPEFVKVLARKIPGYMERLSIPPGITGLAQINLPPDTDLNSVRRKLILDLDYAKRAGLGLDLRMLVCTTLRMLGIRGQFATSLMRLNRLHIIPGDLFQPSHDDDRPATPQTITSLDDGGEEKIAKRA